MTARWGAFAAALLVGVTCLVAAEAPASAADTKGAAVRVSASAKGVQGNNRSYAQPDISADGTRVAFLSDASNLVPHDTNEQEDLFVKNLTTGQIVRVSTTSSGKQTKERKYGGSFFDPPSLSADGTKVAFVSDHQTLIPDREAYSGISVFVKDLKTGAVVRASTSAKGAIGNLEARNPALSGNGRKVAFSSSASNLLPGDKKAGGAHIYVKDLSTGAVVRASTTAKGAPGDGFSDYPSLSDDGRRIAFTSTSMNLVPGGAEESTDVFVKDLTTGAIVWSSVGLLKAYDNIEKGVSLSADGTRIAFASSSGDLVKGDTNDRVDVFVKDLKSGRLTRASTSTAGVQAIEDATFPAISADGTRVAFDSNAPDLVAGDDNFSRDVFVKNLKTGVLTRVSTTSSGGDSNKTSHSAAVSADGRRVAFVSRATNLVKRDTNRFEDVFAKRLP